MFCNPQDTCYQPMQSFLWIGQQGLCKIGQASPGKARVGVPGHSSKLGQGGDAGAAHQVTANGKAYVICNNQDMRHSLMQSFLHICQLVAVRLGRLHLAMQGWPSLATTASWAREVMQALPTRLWKLGRTCSRCRNLSSCSSTSSSICIMTEAEAGC